VSLNAIETKSSFIGISVKGGLGGLANLPPNLHYL
jgi:hypothetical protein